MLAILLAPHKELRVTRPFRPRVRIFWVGKKIRGKKMSANVSSTMVVFIVEYII